VASPGQPKSRSVFILLTLVTATVLLLGSTSPLRGVRGTVGDALAPVRKFGSAVTAPVRDWFGSVNDYRSLRSENEKLRNEVAELKGQEAQVQDALRIQRELLRLNKLEGIDDIKSVPARVIGRSLSNFEETIEIDRGSSSGIKEGMPVVTGAGLVGRVFSVSKASARVVLLTDRKSRTGIRLARSGVVGIAFGVAPGEPLRVDRIDLETVVEKGESVVTAGVPGARFPAGITVGIVKSATVQPGSLQQDITIEPLAELQRLSFVRVLLWEPPAPPPDVPPTIATIPGLEDPATTTTITPVDSTLPESIDPATDPIGDPAPVETIEEPVEEPVEIVPGQPVPQPGDLPPVTALEEDVVDSTQPRVASTTTPPGTPLATTEGTTEATA
jgi:rod shape-determining protein MreC